MAEIVVVDVTTPDAYEYCCARCGVQAVKLLCAGCERVAYCTRECQFEHWSRHKHSCGCAGRQNRLFLSPFDELSEAVGAVLDVSLSAIPSACPAAHRVAGRGRLKRVFTPKFPISAYPVISKLGEGSFGAVWKHQTSKGEVAVKSMMFGKDGSMPNYIGTELLIRNLSHPNVMSLCRAGVLSVGPTDEPAVMLIVMDLANMDLFKLIAKYKNAAQQAPAAAKRSGVYAISPEELPYLAYQLVAGVAYCHARMINILDIKPENIMVRGTVADVQLTEADPHSRIKLKQLLLADFGLAKELALRPSGTKRGTPDFMPPEFFPAKGSTPIVSHFADIWALGCVLYAMATGEALVEFTGSKVELKERLLEIGMWSPHASVPFDKQVTAKLTAFPGLSDLLRGMIMTDLTRRFDIRQVALHPYIANSKAAHDLRDMFPLEIPAYLYSPRTMRMTIEPAYAIEEMTRQSAAHRPLDFVQQHRLKVTDIMFNRVNEFILRGYFASDDPEFDTLFAALALSDGYYKYAVQYQPILRYAAYACYKFAAETRDLDGIALRNAGEMIVPDAMGVVSASSAFDVRKLTKEQLRIATALDFDLTRPTVYDFLRAHAAILATKYRLQIRSELVVTVLILVARRIAWDAHPIDAIPPKEEAVLIFSLVAEVSDLLWERTDLEKRAIDFKKERMTEKFYLIIETVAPFLRAAQKNKTFNAVLLDVLKLKGVVRQVADDLIESITSWEKQ